MIRTRNHVRWAREGLLLAALLVPLLACKKAKREAEEPAVSALVAAPPAASAPPPPPAAAPVPAPAAAPTSAGAISVGSPVLAPWSRAGTLYGGKVTELYGKLGHVQFSDGDRGWALLEKMRPAGTALPEPTDPCGFKVGDKVKAPWSRSRAMYSGTVTEVHGKLGRVDFLDGDQGWAPCAEMTPR